MLVAVAVRRCPMGLTSTAEDQSSSHASGTLLMRGSGPGRRVEGGLCEESCLKGCRCLTGGLQRHVSRAVQLSFRRHSARKPSAMPSKFGSIERMVRCFYTSIYPKQ